MQTTTGEPALERCGSRGEGLRHSRGRRIVFQDAQLAEVLTAYYRSYAQELPGAHVFRAAAKDAFQVWGLEVDVSDLDNERQLQLVTQLRKRGLSDWTIQTRLNMIWAAMRWHKRWRCKSLVIPEKMRAEDWKPYLPNREHTFDTVAMGKLFVAAAAVEPTTQLRSRDHWWRFLWLAFGTAGRIGALLELTWDQVDLRLGRIKLNPDGRRQTKKRRALVPIAPALLAEMRTWSHDGERVITRNGKPVASRSMFADLARAAGVKGGAAVIRHTVRTRLAEGNVPDGEADVFMGHKEEGSSTGARYKHRKPEYLKAVVQGLEGLYGRIASRCPALFTSRQSTHEVHR